MRLPIINIVMVSKTLYVERVLILPSFCRSSPPEPVGGSESAFRLHHINNLFPFNLTIDFIYKYLPIYLN